MRTRKAGCLFKIMTSLALSLLIIFLIIYLSIPYLVTSAVHIAGKAIGVEMEMESFSLNLPEQSMEIGNFYINNPEGFDANSKAFSLDKLHLNVDSVFSNYLFEDLIDVEELVIDGFSMTFEATSLSALLSNENNINVILDKLRSEEANAGKEPSEDKIIIRKMSFKNGLIVSSLTNDIKLPDFEIFNIGTKERPVGYLEAVILILTEISKQSISAIISEQNRPTNVDYGTSIREIVVPVEGSINRLMEGSGTIFDGF